MGGKFVGGPYPIAASPSNWLQYVVRRPDGEKRRICISVYTNTYTPEQAAVKAMEDRPGSGPTSGPVVL